MPHLPEAACSETHCYSHGEDEEQEPAYRICGECFHIYPTAADLVNDHNTQMQALAGHWGGVVRTETDPDEIFGCCWCMHDW